MNALRIRKKLDSPIPELPELTPMIGEVVEIIVVEETAPAGENGCIPSLEQLRSELPGDPFGSDFETTLREWRTGYHA
ncbi:MAG TPA: hypothetical protein VH370_27640 [Humisphaera sp.]|jgi:hypothetical protein|nr:hypothetical protein [Humisphaera sp.]